MISIDFIIVNAENRSVNESIHPQIDLLKTWRYAKLTDCIMIWSVIDRKL